MSGLGVICEEPPQRCELCGTIAETRPYGLNHEEICFDCGMKDKSITEIRAKEMLFGGTIR